MQIDLSYGLLKVWEVLRRGKNTARWMMVVISQQYSQQIFVCLLSAPNYGFIAAQCTAEMFSRPLPGVIVTE